jgi:murein DD-endopeptidase MepM/ murein hydrolase activator NlpD
MKKKKIIIIILSLFLLINLINQKIYSDNSILLNYYSKDKNIVYFFSKDFSPGKPHFFLVYAKDKEFLNEIIVDYAKFYFVKLFNDKNWYLAFFSINIPYNEEKIEIKLRVSSDKKIIFRYVYQLPPKEKKESKGYSTTINATQKMVDLSKQPDLATLEREFFQKIYTINNKEKYYSLPFNYPLEKNIVISPFGLARAYKDSNGNIYKISYHYGVDLKANEGTKIYSSNNGIVRFAGFKDIRGNCVVIDHGFGIYTTYFHMSKIVVKEGDYLKKGTYIGDAGATGSATGPHLHWEFRINNVLIDGMLMVKISNMILNIISNFDEKTMKLKNININEIYNDEDNSSDNINSSDDSSSNSE